MKWIADQQGMAELSAELQSATRVAVDTEADSLHSYFDKVCLIQLSIPGQDFVIDPLSGIDLQPLGDLLADPSVTKVFHGADYDLRILRRDFDFGVTNLVDTMVCAQLLGYESFGLSALLKRHFDVDMDKSHQRADWSLRPLPPAMLEYATKDTYYLLSLSEQLQGQLVARERWEWALEEFAKLEAVRFRDTEEKEESFRRIKGANKLERRGLAGLSLLHDWRDGLARKADRPPFKIIGNEALVDLAREMPRDLDSLKKLKSVSTFHFGKYGRKLLELIEQAAAMPEESLPEKSEGKAWNRDRALERRLDKLKFARDQVARDLGIEASLLAPKHVLTAIAERQPSTVEDLEAIPAMRQWQKNVLGTRLLEALHGTLFPLGP